MVLIRYHETFTAMYLSCIIFLMYCSPFGKVVAVPRTLNELIIIAKCKLGLPAATKVYTAKGGVIDDIDLIRCGKKQV